MARRGGIVPRVTIRDYRDSDEAAVIVLARGIGRTLLNECEKRARAAGQKWLRLGVHAGNHGARAFYAKAGLEEAFLTLEKRLL